MKTKILVIEEQFNTSVLDLFVDFFANDQPNKVTPHCTERSATTCSCRRSEPLTEWGIAGQPADENKIFGAEFAVNEPKARDYRHRWQFESDHAAYDKFVEAGEDCAARGMLRPDGVKAHRVNAIRKRIEDGPVFDLDLIGETDWWS